MMSLSTKMERKGFLRASWACTSCVVARDRTHLFRAGCFLTNGCVPLRLCDETSLRESPFPRPPRIPRHGLSIWRDLSISLILSESFSKYHVPRMWKSKSVVVGSRAGDVMRNVHVSSVILRVFFSWECWGTLVETEYWGHWGRGVTEWDGSPDSCTNNEKIKLDNCTFLGFLSS
jgi:hypothetical protein